MSLGKAKGLLWWGLGLWVLLTAVGYSLYWGVRLLRMMPASLDAGRGLLAAAALSASLAILLSIDKLARDTSDPQANRPKTVAALLFLLLAQRPALLAFLVHGLLVMCLVSYYLFKSLVTVEHAGYGFTIRLPGQTVHLYPVHPYGWQNTGIILEAGRPFTAELTGRASMGYLQHIDEREQHLTKLIDWSRDPNRRTPAPEMSPLVHWPFTGPHGYGADFYAANKGVVSHYRDDRWLTVQGLPHSSVVGLILAKGQAACGRGPTPEEPCRARLEGIDMTPGYVFVPGQGLIHLLAERSTHIPDRTGELWIVINDADEARWDNSGIFFLKLTVSQ